MIQVTVTLKVPGEEHGAYQALFLVDTGATDSMAPGPELTKVGIRPIGKTSYELANGDVQEHPFGLAQIEFMGEVTAGRVIFGPEGTDPILGVTALGWHHRRSHQPNAQATASHTSQVSFR